MFIFLLTTCGTYRNLKERASGPCQFVSPALSLIRHIARPHIRLPGLRTRLRVRPPSMVSARSLFTTLLHYPKNQPQLVVKAAAVVVTARSSLDISTISSPPHISVSRSLVPKFLTTKQRKSSQSFQTYLSFHTTASTLWASACLDGSKSLRASQPASERRRDNLLKKSLRLISTLAPKSICN